MKPLTLLLIAVTASLAGQTTFGQAAPSTQPAKHDPLGFLTSKLHDPKHTTNVLAALRASEDPDLLPMFEAFCRSGDKDYRLFATAALAQIGKDKAKDALSQRLADDPSPAVRIEAMLGLSTLKLITPQQAVEAMKSPDEQLQMIAARSAARMAAGTQPSGDESLAQQAEKTLEKLVGSRDGATAAMARMSLLSLGNKDQAVPLAKLLQDDKTPAEVVALVLDQVASEKIVAAAELVRPLAQGERPWQVRLRAFRAVSAIDPKAGDALAAEIKKSDQTVFRVHLYRLLAVRGDSAKHLEDLAKGDDAIAALARFDMAKAQCQSDKLTATQPGSQQASSQASPAQVAKASQAAVEAVKLLHPVVLDYVLDRGRDDLDMASGTQDARTTAGDATVSCGPDIYTAALLHMLRNVEGDATHVKAEHVRAVRAATLLCDMGTPDGIAGLRSLLSGKYTTAMRLAATGLLRSQNKAACDLMRPLLASPYQEMSHDAALVLGRFGDKDARPSLLEIASKSDRHPMLLVVLANWYILKIDEQSKAAAAALAKDALMATPS